MRSDPRVAVGRASNGKLRGRAAEYKYGGTLAGTHRKYEHEADVTRQFPTWGTWGARRAGIPYVYLYVDVYVQLDTCGWDCGIGIAPGIHLV